MELCGTGTEQSALSARVVSFQQKAKQLGFESRSLSLPNNLPSRRARIAGILGSPYIEGIICLCISLNLVAVVVETNAVASDELVPDWVVQVNRVILGVFCGELGCRMWVFRGGFFRSWWDFMDITIVLVDLISMLLDIFSVGVPSLLGLRLLRLMRFTRGAKIIAKFPQLVLLVKGCVAAVGATFWGIILLGLLGLMWSILAVNVVNPLAKEVAEAGGFETCTRCPHAYSSVQASLLTIFQGVVAGDSWGATTIPIVEAYPGTFFLFLTMFVSMNVALLNVILAVIVENAMKVSESNSSIVKKEQDRQSQYVARHLRDYFEGMDCDGDGHITKDELFQIIRDSDRCSGLLGLMGVSLDDIEILLHIMDVDDSKNVDFHEFLAQLRKMKSRDPEILLSYIRFSTAKLHRNLNDQVQLLTEQLSTKFEEILREGGVLPQIRPDDDNTLERQLCCEDHVTSPRPSSKSQVAGSPKGAGNMAANRPIHEVQSEQGVCKDLNDVAAKMPLSFRKPPVRSDAKSGGAALKNAGNSDVADRSFQAMRLRAGASSIDSLNMLPMKIDRLRDALGADIQLCIQNFFEKCDNYLLVDLDGNPQYSM